MLGLMMDRPLLLKTILWRAERVFGNQEIVSRDSDSLHRYTYAEYAVRVRRLENVLAGLGIRHGDRVGTLAWNDHRHYEVYFAAPCMGAVLHTINLRLFPEQIARVINHAQDKVLFVAPDMVPLVEKIADQLPAVEAFVVLAAQVPQTSLKRVYSYEELLALAADSYEFPEFDENTASAMCYTSATTGDPKGVLYSHRSTFLHTMALGLKDSLAMCEDMVMLPIAPMFHVNSWGIPFGAAMHGTKLVLPGPRPTPETILELVETERVTHAAAAVTVGIQIREHLEAVEKTRDLSSLRTFLLGGQAPPRNLMEWFERELGVYVVQGWGATECNPIVSWDFLKRRHLEADDEELRFRMRGKQGVPYPGVEVRVVDDGGAELTWDGEAVGHLQLRGPWVCRAYYLDPERTRQAFTEDGWFRSGDVGTIDQDGYVALIDRAADLIKSGGEWISSIDLENALMAHPGVSEAVVVAVPDERWIERPMAVVAAVDQASLPSADELRAVLARRVPKWWIPDKIAFVSEIPKTGVGKFDKRAIRAMLPELVIADTRAVSVLEEN